jgi:hypothetical protein
MNASEATLALFLFVAGVVALAAAFAAVLGGLLPQAAAFGLGGLYVVVWSGRRLIPDEARSRS